MTQILKLKVENILGAKDVEFKPNGESVTIGGANGEGKSSAIRALIMALGGKARMPDEPVHKGAEKGSVVIELDKFKVTYEVDKERNSKIKVENAEGMRFATPQKMLNELFGNLAFNPGEFIHMDKEKRFKTLTDLLNIDPLIIEMQIRHANDERREVGRKVKEIEGKLVGREKHSDCPDELVNFKEKLDELSELQAINRGLSEKEATIAQERNKYVLLSMESKKLYSEIERLKSEISKAEKLIEENTEEKSNIESRCEAIRREVDEALKLNNTREKAELLHASLGNIEIINNKVRENKEFDTLQSELDKSTQIYDDFTSQIRKLEEEKLNLLANVKVPIEGLSFDGGSVLFNGYPFEQIAESEQWEISTAIGFELNKKSILLMPNCGGLDRATRDQVRARAAACGVQLFLEVVDDADDVQILIEDGLVAENRLEPRAE